MVGELVTNPAHEPKAYSIMPFVWSIGTILGPALCHGTEIGNKVRGDRFQIIGVLKLKSYLKLRGLKVLYIPGRGIPHSRINPVPGHVTRSEDFSRTQRRPIPIFSQSMASLVISLGRFPISYVLLLCSSA